MGCGTAAPLPPQPGPAAPEADTSPPVVDVPLGYHPVSISGVLATLDGDVAVLRHGDEAVIPVAIGRRTAMSLSLELQGQREVDLIHRVLALTGASLRQVRLDLVEGSVEATLVLETHDELHEVPARAADALHLAASEDAPLYASPAIVEGRAIPTSELLAP